MFKWTNHVKPRQFLPQPHSFSIKTPSFQASWSNPLSPVMWDTFRPGAPPLKNLLLLHQGVVFYSWFLGARWIGSWVGVSPLGSFTTRPNTTTPWAKYIQTITILYHSLSLFPSPSPLLPLSHTHTYTPQRVLLCQKENSGKFSVTLALCTTIWVLCNLLSGEKKTTGPKRLPEIATEIKQENCRWWAWKIVKPCTNVSCFQN